MSNKSEGFVNYLLNSIHRKGDKGFRAKCRKADNEATEYYSWDILSPWVNLENMKERKSYQLIASSVSQSDRETDGSLSLGKALYVAYSKDGKEGESRNSSQAARLRRILACKDSLELIDNLRTILRYLKSKEVYVSHTLLLDNILWFDHDNSRERIRSRWAQDFYSGVKEDKE